MEYSNTVRYYSATTEKLESSVDKQMYLEATMLSEISQTMRLNIAWFLLY